MDRKEEEAVVLDFLPFGKASEAKKEPVAQVIGTELFTMLEVVPRPEAKMALMEKVYIGKGDRDKIDHIKKRINYPELTTTAQSELPKAVTEIVKSREALFINFFNKAGPINIRAHSLELLPAIGKKNLTAILEERQKKPFESFKELHDRVPHIVNPEQIIAQRILQELKEASKYYLFIKPPKLEEEERLHYS